MQRFRLRDHDQLRRGPGGYPESQRLHPRQQGPPGIVQDEQMQIINGLQRVRKKKNGLPRSSKQNNTPP